MLFKLGRVVATPGALRAIEENNVDTWSLLQRHVKGDWGCVSEEDQQENRRAVANGYRVMSIYALNEQGDVLWVITEAERSSTCLMLPEEY